MKQAWFLLGRSYQKLGRQEEAKEAFKKIEQTTAEELSREQGNVPAGETGAKSAAPSKKLSPPRGRRKSAKQP